MPTPENSASKLSSTASAGTPKPAGRLRSSAGNLLISKRLKVLDGLECLDDLERSLLQDAKYQLEHRPEAGRVELMRHLVGHLDPQDALRWHLLNAMQLTDKMCKTSLRPPGRHRLVDTLQKIASILGRDLPIARASGDTDIDREFQRQTRLMAAAFRSLKIQVLLPKPGSARLVMAQLVQAFHAEACDNWLNMPGLDRSEPESANSLRRQEITIVVTRRGSAHETTSADESPTLP